MDVTSNYTYIHTLSHTHTKLHGPCLSTHTHVTYTTHTTHTDTLDALGNYTYIHTHTPTYTELHRPCLSTHTQTTHTGTLDTTGNYTSAGDLTVQVFPPHMLEWGDVTNPLTNQSAHNGGAG